MAREVLLDIKNLKKYFPIKNFFGAVKGEVKAVDNISFQIYKGETFGLVGESGCGKSTLGRGILRMLDVNGGNVALKRSFIEDRYYFFDIIIQVFK